MSRRARQDVSPKLRQDVAAHLFTQHKTACLLTLSPLACHEAACSEPVKRRFNAWSGRRGSNPRQPAWKAGCHTLAASLLRTALTGSCIPYTSNVSVSDKRCHAHFLALLAKDVTCIFAFFGKRCHVISKAGFPELRAL